MAFIGIKTLTGEVRLRLDRLRATVKKEPMLKIAGEIMVGSIHRTMREQGSPANSWAPLAASTIKRRRNKKKSSIRILQDSRRLYNSISYKINPRGVVIGPSADVPYAEIHQRGGEAGRRPPFKKKNGRRPFIPARPYVVLRPEDPERIRTALQQYVEKHIAQGGL